MVRIVLDNRQQVLPRHRQFTQHRETLLLRMHRCRRWLRLDEMRFGEPTLTRFVQPFLRLPVVVECLPQPHTAREQRANRHAQHDESRWRKAQPAASEVDVERLDHCAYSSRWRAKLLPPSSSGQAFGGASVVTLAKRACNAARSTAMPQP